MPLYIRFPEWISPVIVPGLPFRWYGLMYLVAFGVTYQLTRIQLRDPRTRLSRPMSEDDVINLFFWMIVGLLIGSRLVATTLYDTSGRYLREPWLIFWPFDDQMRFVGLQGMSYHGGLIGAVVAGVVYGRVKRFDILGVADAVVTAVPLGYTFGRIGNFINGELYGRITAAPFGVLFPHANPVPTDHPQVARIAREVGIDISGMSAVNLPRHPSQLYEALLEGVVLWIVLWFGFRLRKPFRGFMVGAYTVGYAVARFIAEYFRQPDPGLDFVVQWGSADNPRWLLTSPWNLTTGQLLSVVMAIAGVALIAALAIRARKAPKVEMSEPIQRTDAGENRD